MESKWLPLWTRHRGIQCWFTNSWFDKVQPPRSDNVKRCSCALDSDQEMAGTSRPQLSSV